MDQEAIRARFLHSALFMLFAISWSHFGPCFFIVRLNPVLTSTERLTPKDNYVNEPMTAVYQIRKNTKRNMYIKYRHKKKFKYL